jgi:two-component system sensor histidine kinase AtoS
VLLNAIQATPPSGLISLRAVRDGDDHALIELSDTGRGVSAEALSKLTDPFYTTRAKGMGLGLTISRQLAELNHCTLTLSSVEGRGTTVSLRVPLAREAET